MPASAAAMAMPDGYGLGVLCLPPAGAQVSGLPLALRFNSNRQSYLAISLGELRLPGVASHTIASEPLGPVAKKYRLSGEPAGAQAAAGADAENAVSVTVSRLTPAVLIELHGYSVALFMGQRLEWWTADEPGAPPRKGDWRPDEGKFKQARPPMNYAVGGADSVRMGVFGPDDAWLEGADEGWVLLWNWQDAWFPTGPTPMEMVNLFMGPDGDKHASPGDAPLLVLCSHAPTVELSGSVPAAGMIQGGDAGPVGPDSGFVFTFDEPGARMAVLPLYGYRFPAASETEQWARAGELPDDVKTRCEWWARNSAAYPVSVEETWSYDPESDIATTRGVFAYERIRESGAQCAPLPPMLELARQAGFPIAVSGAIADSGMALYCGPYAAVENSDCYAASVEGLGKYALERHAAQSSEGAIADAARSELNSEIDKMLESGLLAPAYLPYKFATGWGQHTMTRMLYSAPGQTLSTLAAALPFLDPARRQRVIEYMAEMRETFPPETIAHLPAVGGARREAWDVLEPYIETVFLPQNNFHLLNNLVPAQALYDLAAYYRVVGKERMEADGFELDTVLAKTVQPWIDRQDWAALGWYSWPRTKRDGWMLGSYGWNMPVDANRLAAAFIGMARLARMGGDVALENAAMAQLARTLTHRFASLKYVGWLYKQGGFLLQPEGFDPADDPRDVNMSERQAIIGYSSGFRRLELPRFTDEEGPYMAMPPELARFFADFVEPEAMSFARQTELSYSDAFLTLGTPHRLDEWWHNYPSDSLQIFMVHARILGDGADGLWRMRDTPFACVGDLYHIEKLTTVLSACGQGKWTPFAAE